MNPFQKSSVDEGESSRLTHGIGTENSKGGIKKRLKREEGKEEKSKEVKKLVIDKGNGRGDLVSGEGKRHVEKKNVGQKGRPAEKMERVKTFP